MTIPMRLEGVYYFGPFRLDPVRRLLSQDGVPVTLTGRLFNALMVLVVNHDRMVTRTELEAAVWPSRQVEENNLGQAIYALRKVLQVGDPAERFIVTVQGRGYQFAIPVTFEAGRLAPLQDTGQAVSQDEQDGRQARRIHQTRQWRPRLAWGIAASLALLLILFIAAGPGDPGRTAARTPIAPFAPPPHSLAILAFTNLDGTPDREYFSDGLSEELIASLGRLPALQVAASSSSFAFKGKSASAPAIGRSLNVRAVLEGTVRRDGMRLRVTATLIDAVTGYMLWAHIFDCDQSGVFAVQEQIAEAVTQSVQVTLLSDDGQKLTLGSTSKPQALDAYLRGMKARNEHTDDGIRRAGAAFREALALDPNYVLAHVQDANVLIMNAEGYGAGPTDAAHIKDMQQAALTEAQAAVAAAPGLAEAHAVLALAYAEFWDFSRQSVELARAQTLAPSNSRILMAYARFQVDIGHAAAAAAAANRAVALDPLATDMYVDLAGVLALARRPDDARVALHHAALLGFSGAPSTDLLARTELMQGKAEAAWQDCAGELDWYQLVCRAMAGHMIGNQTAAAAALAKLQTRLGDAAAYQYARIYAVWGQQEAALHWLETAYRMRDDGLIDMHVDSFLDQIRDLPRFKILEAKLGIAAP